jgi:diguanylate cyclase
MEKSMESNDTAPRKRRDRADRPLPIFDAVPVLKKADVFASLEESELAILSSASRAYRFAAGKPVFSLGESGDSLFIVVSGTMHVLKENEHAAPTVIAELVKGDAFGELELLTSTPRTASVVAATDAVLLRFPRKGLKFESLLNARPGASAHMLFDFLRTIAGRIRNANARIKEDSPWVQEIRKQVYADKLTGLFNKTYLEENLAGYLKDPAKPVSLLMFKPDNFKQINDTYGHEAGDAVLTLMSAELGRTFGEDDPCVRYMGNELAVVLAGRDRGAALAEAKRLLGIMNALDISKSVANSGLTLSLSIGIAVFPEHGRDHAELIAAAHELPLIGRARGGNLILFPEDK